MELTQLSLDIASFSVQALEAPIIFSAATVIFLGFVDGLVSIMQLLRRDSA